MTAVGLAPAIAAIVHSKVHQSRRSQINRLESLPSRHTNLKSISDVRPTYSVTRRS